MQIWESVEKMSKFTGFFLHFLDILNKMKDNLCQKCVKGRHLSLQGKFETIAPGFLKKDDGIFQFCTYFSTCPSLESGFPTRTKIIFLNRSIQ